MFEKYAEFVIWMLSHLTLGNLCILTENVHDKHKWKTNVNEKKTYMQNM